MNATDRGIAAASPPPLPTDHPLHPRCPGTGRYHGLDVVRAAMMLLGVVIHTALVYCEPQIWIYEDPDRTAFAGILVLGIHIFRMPAFFVMAGFFGAMLFDRRGPGGFTSHRYDRIVLPLAIGWFVIYPLLAWSISFAFTWSYLPAEDRTIGLAYDKMSLNADFAEAGPMHLWFLYYLVYYYLAFATATYLLRRFSGPVAGWLRTGFRSLALGRLRWVGVPAVIVATSFLMLTMEEPGIDTAESFWPMWHVMFLYAIYFGVGWLAFGNRELVDRLKNWAWIRLGVGATLLVVAVILAIATSAAVDAQEEYAEAMFIANQCLQATTCWILILGITGVSERLFTRANPAVRYMVDASYWIYLMHLPLTFFIPSLFRGWNMWGIVKMPVMIVLVTVVLLIVYHVAVRGTALGVLLNGRRYPVWPFTRARGSEPAPTE
jgi:peptidoglycan/LPS O-acetylase OafA/YrhL